LTGLKRFVDKRFKDFGVNKKREITRLVYEISKRDKISYKTVLDHIKSGTPYFAVKDELLRRRFPLSSVAGEPLCPHFPGLKINPKEAVKINPGKNPRLNPRYVYIEEDVRNSCLAQRARGIFPAATFKNIVSLKDYIGKRPGFTISDYNRRRDNIFITSEKYDFFKRCPCTKAALGCGYHILNLGFGCVFECTYCYLQEYTNCPGIILPSNVEDFFDKFGVYKRRGMRIGTGEFTDSLAMDHVTQYSMEIVEFFKKNQDVTFEFKTKSNNIKNLLKSRHAGNIVVSWSLNPERLVRENEFYSVSLEERLNAASECVRAGYKVGFHFDPIIYGKNWETGYKGLVNSVFDKVPYKSIAWISLGTFRFNPYLKTIIENRFPENKILDEELLIGFDGKLRYPARLRFFIYENILEWITKRAKGLYVYLCMEDAEMNKLLNFKKLVK